MAPVISAEITLLGRGDPIRSNYPIVITSSAPQILAALLRRQTHRVSEKGHFIAGGTRRPASMERISGLSAGRWPTQNWWVGVRTNQDREERVPVCALWLFRRLLRLLRGMGEEIRANHDLGKRVPAIRFAVVVTALVPFLLRWMCKLVWRQICTRQKWSRN